MYLQHSRLELPVQRIPSVVESQTPRTSVLWRPLQATTNTDQRTHAAAWKPTHTKVEVTHNVLGICHDIYHSMRTNMWFLTILACDMSAFVKASHAALPITLARWRRVYPQCKRCHKSMLSGTHYNMYELSHTIPDLALLGRHTDGNNLGAAVAVGEAIYSTCRLQSNQYSTSPPYPQPP